MRDRDDMRIELGRDGGQRVMVGKRVGLVGGIGVLCYSMPMVG